MTFRGLRTRAQIGLRAPRSISRAITPGGASGGVTLHYGGPRVGITGGTSHASCESRWKGWQNYHMDSHKWADIAYTLGACQHGYLLAGRGAGVRTAANGTNIGNQTSYAICWIGGQGDAPTQDALDAIDEGIRRLRAAGAGLRVWSHQDWRSTSCAGPQVTAHARRRNSQAIPAAAEAPATSSDLRMPLDVDGAMGRQTRMAFEVYVDRSRVDGEWDGLDVRRLQSWAGHERTGALDRSTTRAVQSKLGIERTGIWDQSTTAQFQRFLNRRFADGSLQLPGAPSPKA